MRNGCLVLKKQVSLQKPVSTFGDQLLLEIVQKCNLVLCSGGSLEAKIPSLQQKADTNTLSDDFFGRREPHVSIAGLFFGLWIIYMDPSFIHRHKTILQKSVQQALGYTSNQASFQWIFFHCRVPWNEWHPSFLELPILLVSQDGHHLHCSNAVLNPATQFLTVEEEGSLSPNATDISS
jgi:hypothetical protein